MVLIFEQDKTGGIQWIPELYRGKFAQKMTWRFVLGMWSLSYFGSETLMDFHDQMVKKAIKWDHGG